MTDCEDAAHRLQWRDRGRFSRPFLFPRFTKRGTARTGVVRTATTYGKLAPAVGKVNGAYQSNILKWLDTWGLFRIDGEIRWRGYLAPL